MRQSFILQKSLLNPALRKPWNAMLARAGLEPWGLIPTVTYRGRYGRICPAAASTFWTNPKPHHWSVAVRGGQV